MNIFPLALTQYPSQFARAALQTTSKRTFAQMVSLQHRITPRPAGTQQTSILSDFKVNPLATIGGSIVVLAFISGNSTSSVNTAVAGVRNRE